MASRKPVKTVRVERSIFSVKSLFAEYSKGAKKARGTMFFDFGENRKLEVRSMSMGAFHLLVLEALIAEAQAGLDWQTPRGPKPVDRDMREMMKLRDKAARSDNLTVTVSYYAIAVSMGRRPDTRLRRQIDEALLDLADTQFIWRKADGKPIESYHLLSYIKSSPDSEKGPVKVSICPALSEVINNERPYTRVDMDEVRSLEHKVTVLLHGWLSSIISPGQTTPINIDTILDGNIWAQEVEKGSSTYRTRRSTLMNKLLPDLENAGWAWNYDSKKDQVIVKRPKKIQKLPKTQKKRSNSCQSETQPVIATRRAGFLNFSRCLAWPHPARAGNPTAMIFRNGMACFSRKIALAGPRAVFLTRNSVRFSG